MVILNQRIPLWRFGRYDRDSKYQSLLKIAYTSGHLKKTLVAVLTKTNQAIAVIKKPFLLDMLDHMINNTELFNKLDKINTKQEKRSEDKIIRDDDRIRKLNLKEN